MAFANRLAILSGGTGGLGSVTGRSLRAQGAKLALLYAPFESDRIKEDVKTCYGEGEHDDIIAYECDVTSPESVNKAFAAITKDIEKAGYDKMFPSILLNAMGYVSLYPFEEFPIEEIDKHLQINIKGPMLVSQQFAKLYFRFKEEMQKSNSDAKVPPGRIVSMASQAAHVSLIAHGIYCATKAGVIGLSNCMASEWAGKGITSNTISPGVIWTAMGKRAWADKELREDHQKHIPNNRFGEPEEIAATVSFLCQDAAGHVNGADIRVDGGYTIR